MRRVRNAERRIRHRLRDRAWAPRDAPMFQAANIHHDVADKARGMACGGIGATLLLGGAGRLRSLTEYLQAGMA